VLARIGRGFLWAVAAYFVGAFVGYWLIMGTFQIVWVYYGILVESRPVIVWNIIAVGINFLVVGAYFYFASTTRRHTPLINHPAPGESTKSFPGR
jgi:hypothetical protein